MTLDEAVEIVRAYWAGPRQSDLLEAARLGCLVRDVVRALAPSQWPELADRLTPLRPAPPGRFPPGGHFARLVALIDRRDWLGIPPPRASPAQDYLARYRHLAPQRRTG